MAKVPGPNLGLQMLPFSRLLQRQQLTMTPKLEQHGEQTRKEILDKFASKARNKRGRESTKLEQQP